MRDRTVKTNSVFRKRTVALLSAPILAVSLAACETMSQAEQGEIIGGVIGGVVGAQVGDGRGETVAIIIGTIAGSMIGRQIGESMDDTDRMRTAYVLNNSKTGESTTWTNPDNGRVYAVTPTRTYEQGTGPCREFRLDASVGENGPEEVYGTACLQADGSWLIQ